MEVEIGQDANRRPGMDVSLSSPITVERLFAACTGIQTAEVAINKKDPSEDQPDSESRYLNSTTRITTAQQGCVSTCMRRHRRRSCLAACRARVQSEQASVVQDFTPSSCPCSSCHGSSAQSASQLACSAEIPSPLAPADAICLAAGNLAVATKTPPAKPPGSPTQRKSGQRRTERRR